MKNRILLILSMVIVLACVLALSVSAATFDKTETVTVKLTNGTQQCELYDADDNELTWYTLDGGATVVSVKTSDLVFSSETSLADISLSDGTVLQKQNENSTNKIVVANLRGKTFTKVTHTGYKTTFGDSKTVQYVYLPSTVTNVGCNVFQNCSNLKVCDFPSDAVFSIDDANAFVSCTSLVEMNLIGCTKFGTTVNHHSIFSGCTSLQRVIIDPDNFEGTVLGGNLFNNCPLTQFGLVPNECHIPDTVETMGINVFKNCRFAKLYIGDSLKTTGYNVFDGNTYLTEVHFNSNYETMDQRAFMGCTSLTTLYGFENTKLEVITYQAFKNTSIEEIILPNTVESIEQDAFIFSVSGVAYDYTMKKVVLGANFTSFASYDGFKNRSGLEEVYIPAGCTSIPGNVFNVAASNCVFYFTGTKDQLDALVANTNSNNTAFLDAYKQAKSVAEYNAIETKSGRCIVYGYSACEAFYNGVHEDVGANGSACYLDDCKNCLYTQMYIGNDETHSFFVEYTYANGYMQAGQIVSICQNSGCKHGTESTAVTSPLDALFNSLEYSVAEKGFGICVKYNVNKDALAVYKNSGKSISFGVVAIMADKVQGNGPLANNGKLTTEKNVVAADVTADNLRAVTLRIAGDENAWKNNANRAIYVLGYATNGTDLEYLGTASGAQVDRNNITSVKSLVIGQFFDFNV